MNNIQAHKRNYTFRYDIGNILDVKSGKIKIINRFRNNGYRMYYVECLTCKYKYNTREHQIINGVGCKVCSGNRVIIGYNDFNTKYHELSEHLVNKKDGEDKSSSTTKVKWLCKKCNNIYLDSLSNVVRRGILCPFCESSYSFGEGVMEQILYFLNVDYKHNTSFKWSNKKKYDFYIPNKKTIIEIHGKQHFARGFENLGGKTLQEEINNDKYKRNLALNNGILHYIEIDCRNSSINWIKNNILNNQDFCEIFDISTFNWDGLIYNYNNYNIDNISSLWNKGYSVCQISDELGLDRHYVQKQLTMYAKIDKIDYSQEISKNRKYRIVSSKKSKPIKCITTNQFFSSSSLCEKLSIDIFGTRLTSANMARQIKRNSPHKGFLFEYISKEEFNKRKEESPELAFGDSFIL